MLFAQTPICSDCEQSVSKVPFPANVKLLHAFTLHLILQICPLLQYIVALSPLDGPPNVNVTSDEFE